MHLQNDSQEHVPQNHHGEPAELHSCLFCPPVQNHVITLVKDAVESRQDAEYKRAKEILLDHDGFASSEGQKAHHGRENT